MSKRRSTNMTTTVAVYPFWLLPFVWLVQIMAWFIRVPLMLFWLAIVWQVKAVRWAYRTLRDRSRR